MTFEFDTQSSKLIERTWKGIPDRWRSTAWYSFLEASARRHKGSPHADELIEAYNELQFISSPDDVQIDIDVPRTISSHIMFRRRYRGGQVQLALRWGRLQRFPRTGEIPTHLLLSRIFFHRLNIKRATRQCNNFCRWLELNSTQQAVHSTLEDCRTLALFCRANIFRVFPKTWRDASRNATGWIPTSCQTLLTKLPT